MYIYIHIYIYISIYIYIYWDLFDLYGIVTLREESDRQVDVALAGGMESMSQVPYFLRHARRGGYHYGHGTSVESMQGEEYEPLAHEKTLADFCFIVCCTWS